MKLIAAALAFLIGMTSSSYASAAGSLGVSTYAGTGAADTGGDNTDATQSAVKFPRDVAVDTEGNLYIADTFNHRIQKVDTTGAVTTFAGTGTAGTGGNEADATQSALYSPFGVAVDAAGNVYIADYFNHRIQKVDTGGAVTTFAGTGSQGAGDDNADATQSALDTPYGVFVDAAGNVYITDTYNHRIRKVDTTGAITTIAGTGTAGAGGDNTDATQSALSYPHGVAVDAAGNLYIADTVNSRVQKIVYDTIDPTITASATPSTANIGDTITIGYTCADTDGSGIDTCAATLNDNTVNNGDTLDASSRGTHILIVTATDNAGNTTTQTIPIIINGKRELTGDYKAAAGTTGSIARLYMAAFARTSPEFVALYGSTTSTEFVDLMYQNVMGRTADTEGHAFWLNQLDDGMSQARLLLMLSESPEFKQITYTS